MRRYLAPPIIVMLLLVSACSGQTPGTDAISGVVYDPTNRAVANADVLEVDVHSGANIERYGDDGRRTHDRRCGYAFAQPEAHVVAATQNW